MARSKEKERVLTPEEKLAQALVPDWEQPYKVPKNWCWTKIGVISDFERGITFPASAKETDPTEENIPCLRTANVQENLEIDDLIYVNRSFMKGNDAKLVRENDIIMSSANSRELVGKASFVTHVPFPMTFGGFVLNIRARGTSSKYLFYFLRQEFLAGKFMDESAQTTNIANINTTTLGGYELPLPPLSEQQRIVDRIEYLFTKLDEAKEKSQSMLDSLETRKAAILHKAFTGELTAKWRADNSASDPWTTKKLSDVAKLQTGLMKGKRFEGSTVFMPYLRVANVQDGYLALDEIKEIEVGATGFDRYLLRNGDVLFTEGGDYDKLGRGTVWRNEIPNCLHQNHIFVVRVDAEMLVPEFLSYQAGSRYGKKYFLSCAKQTTNLASLNSTQLKNFPVLLPTVAEQTEIVRILDSLLVKEQQAKEAAEAVLEKIDLLKKSILARAFRGELGTNDPNEESALELLKKVLDIPAEPKAPVKRTIIPKDLEGQIKTELERKIVKLYIQGNTDVISIRQIMSVSSKRFEIMEALRTLQQRGVLVKENDAYKLLR